MSLRQRTAQPSDSRTTSGSVSDQPTGTPPLSHAANSPRRKGIRLNRILGRIVPIILLIYIGFAYDLVIIRYAYRHLHLQQGRKLLSIPWLLPAHGLFLWSLRAYLRVFFAHSSPSRGANRASGVLSWLRSKLGETYLDPDKLQLLEQQRINHLATTLACGAQVQVELCQSNGQPLQCWRDGCGGRLKAFRTRHCGDCRTCRVGFDHHCAWFDNDVTAPVTLRPFVGFLASIPPLYLLGLGPLFKPSWQTLKRIKAFAAADASLRSSWWDKWYSWVGGPAFRWMVGYALGASRWAQVAEDRLSHESPRAPVLVALGAVFVFVATALAASSLTQLRKGMLTIDLERLKAYHNVRKQLEKLQKKSDGASDDERATAIRLKMESLAPAQHFKVSVRDKSTREVRESIVAVSVEDGLLSHGSAWTNIGRFLKWVQVREVDGPAWSIPESTLRKVLQAAAVIPYNHST